MKLYPRLLLVVLFIASVVALPTQAQTVATASSPLNDSLVTLPDSDVVIYLNASRILNDAMPRLVPEKELQKIRDGMDQMKAFTNVDLRNMEFLVLALRFNKPSNGMMFPSPEAMFTVRGDFDAKALVSMAMLMFEGRLHEEMFGEHPIYTLKLSDIIGNNANNPFGAGFSELAICTLDSGTLAIGNTAFIKAALDAADGHGRIKSETLDSLLRDSNALISVTGSPLKAFAKSFGLRMADSDDPKCTTKFGEYYLSLTMTENNFKFSGAFNADNPETAGIIKNMLTGLLQQGKDYAPDKNSKSMLDQVKIFTEGDELLVEASIPQKTAVDFVRDIFAPPPKPTATDTKAEPATTPAVQKTVKAKPRRRRHRT